MHNTMELFRLLPQLDCGACGNPVCITLSRRIAAGWQKPEECRYISSTNLARVHELLDAGIEVGPKILPEGHLIEIQPCAQYGKVTLEAQLSRPADSIFDVFDSCELCTSLGDVGMLKNVRCSLEMGYSLAEHNEIRIHIFKSGKVVMRHAPDRNQAMEAMKKIQRALWGAVVCVSGNPAIDCVANCCPTYSTKICPCIMWGVTTDTSEPISGKYTLHRVKTLETGHLFLKSLNELDQIVEILKKFFNNNHQIPSLEKQVYGEQIRDLLRTASKRAIEFTVITKREEDAALGLVLRALIRCLGRISDGMTAFQGSENINLMQQAVQMVFNAYNAFKHGDDTTIDDLDKELGSFQTNWIKNNGDSNLIKVASNGVSIAHLTTVMLPK